MKFNPCLVVPHYNHHELIPGVIEKLEPLRLPLILVDDGSDDDSYAAVQILTADVDWIHVLRHPLNRGKGAAVCSGLRHARLNQFTHAIQVDADGQHTIDDIPKLSVLAEKNLAAIISGLPQFDDDIPRSRYYGRMLTHSLIMLETISLRVPDAMCGFRVYPLEQIERVFDRYYLGPRMDFDVEVLVKADWTGIKIHYVPTKVNYPESGVSHFHYIRDNIDITCMHVRLVCGMLPRLPFLIWRQIMTVIS